MNRPTAAVDLRRGSLLPEGPPLAQRVGDAALALTWRLVQPTVRGVFAAGAHHEPLRRLHYVADDGWSADLFHVPASQQGHGTPVLLAHGLGGNHRDFHLEAHRSLAGALAEAGFAVYLLEHRGDPSARPPEDARPFTVDDIATRDVPAALDVIRDHSGSDRVFWVGHGFGAQLLLLHEALASEGRVAAAVSIAGAVRFDPPRSAARNAGLVAALLPSGWVLPTRRGQQALSPFVGAGEQLGSPHTPGDVARGRLRYAAGDLHGGVVRQVARWVAGGALTDNTGRVDVVAALRPFPLLVVDPDADPTCPPDATDRLVGVTGAERLVLEGGWGHLDPLLGTDAPQVVYPAVVDFLRRQPPP